MELILWRHADAGIHTSSHDDIERPLTPKGRRQAAAMANWLIARLPSDVVVLSSPAVRAYETATYLQLGIVVVDALNPDASLSDYLQVTKSRPDATTLLIVGHQPILGQLASKMLTGTLKSWPIKKGAICWIRDNVGVAYVKSLIAPSHILK